ncbi:hypothetical protein C2S51_021039 [Perilla frutescens var. frutescens]|nr:hypothetical protein C2S51_021039 [Perilla frutescens var. frutescens]
MVLLLISSQVADARDLTQTPTRVLSEESEKNIGDDLVRHKTINKLYYRYRAFGFLSRQVPYMKAWIECSGNFFNGMVSPISPTQDPVFHPPMRL